MNKTLNGKGYIKDGEGVFVTGAGEVYSYRDGELTPLTTTEDTKSYADLRAAGSPEPNHNKTKGVVEMNYLGMFELQPLYDVHKSFYGKAFVERWDTGNGIQYVLKSYGAVVAKVTPISACDAVQEVFRVEVGMKHLSATTLRHVKEFLAQTDDVFKGIALSWLRRAIKDGRPIDGGRKVYVLKEL